MDEHATRIWAHRGASAYAPENTLPAFELALAQGAEGVEFDVQLSADGTIVVIHDETLARTTDGTGNVCDHTFAQLRRLDACAGHVGFRGVTIPSLDEVLEVLEPSGVTINIELKNSEVPYPGLEEQVVAAVASFGLAGRVVLSTFSEQSVRRLGPLAGGSELAFLYTDPRLRPWRPAAELGVAAIHPPLPYVFGAGFVRRAQAAGFAVRPWVVDGERSLRRMLRYGVDAVFTNTVDVAVAVRSGG
ncbi:MAG: glycerophosphodiester phosphodiesterase family protein [Propionicimonas sp.]|nr:glycerophosphodiester phosphodiesterase family protein [Propionicimonas sp.]